VLWRSLVRRAPTVKTQALPLEIPEGERTTQTVVDVGEYLESLGQNPPVLQSGHGDGAAGDPPGPLTRLGATRPPRQKARAEATPQHAAGS
jgi:hypothetical protein